MEKRIKIRKRRHGGASGMLSLIAQKYEDRIKIKADKGIVTIATDTEETWNELWEELEDTYEEEL